MHRTRKPRIAVFEFSESPNQSGMGRVLASQFTEHLLTSPYYIVLEHGAWKSAPGGGAVNQGCRFSRAWAVNAGTLVSAGDVSILAAGGNRRALAKSGNAGDAALARRNSRASSRAASASRRRKAATNRSNSPWLMEAQTCRTESTTDRCRREFIGPPQPDFATASRPAIKAGSKRSGICALR